jgi:hypothetical protein
MGRTAFTMDEDSVGAVLPLNYEITLYNSFHLHIFGMYPFLFSLVGLAIFERKLRHWYVPFKESVGLSFLRLKGPSEGSNEQEMI